MATLQDEVDLKDYIIREQAKINQHLKAALTEMYECDKGDEYICSDSEPKISDPEPEVPDTEVVVSDPEAEVPVPEPEVPDHEVDVSDPEPEVSDPEVDISDPEHEVPDPEVDVSDPEPEVSDPEVDVSDPEHEVPDPDPCVVIIYVLCCVCLLISPLVSDTSWLSLVCVHALFIVLIVYLFLITLCIVCVSLLLVASSS